MYRTHTCGELRPAHVGQTVTLAGWVHRQRDHGGITFLDLRDRYGIVQVVADPSNPAVHAAQEARAEWVLGITGIVRRRPAGAENPNLATGEIEVEATRVEVLNPAKTLPFLINKDEETDESVRLKYRYLDLRRERMQRNIILRHKVVKFIRDYQSRTRLPGNRNPDALQDHARRRARLSRAFAPSAGHVLRAAAIAPAAQAVVDGGRLRPLLPDCPLPAR